MMLDFRDAAFNTINKIMEKDEKVIILYNDFGAQGLDKIKSEYPNRAINIGIAEQNMISVAAGLALAGKKVIVYSIAAHVTTRCYEQLKLDVCAMNLPIIIIGMGSGLSYGVDGPTHQSTTDLSLMRALPGINIYNPADAISAEVLIQLAYKNGSPTYIRLDKEQHNPIYNNIHDFSDGLYLFDSEGPVTIITTGILVHRALEVSEKLEEEGIKINVVDLFRIKPINNELLEYIIKNSQKILVLEEHSCIGGIGSIVSEIIAASNYKIPLFRISLKDEICFGSESRSWAHEQCGLSLKSLIHTLKNL